MPTYRRRPRRKIPPPLAGGGAADASPPRGRADRARELRANMTDAEKKLWDALRRKQVNELRFRRQYSLGPYFADFVCLPARLVVEMDGSQHGDEKQAEHDRRRTAWLQSQNFRVMRFLNRDVLKNLEGVVGTIERAMRDGPPPDVRAQSARTSAPSREGRGE
ncbi:MAG TPA: endonuclease domain-containing protein [Rhizomicrobium sp.]|nr:endonuclease domain-containing protein [Rhizomicrobium sp.]